MVKYKAWTYSDFYNYPAVFIHAKNEIEAKKAALNKINKKHPLAYHVQVHAIVKV